MQIPNMYWVSPYYVRRANQSTIHVLYNSVLTMALQVCHEHIEWALRPFPHGVKTFGSMRLPPNDHIFRNIFFDLFDLAKST